MEEAEATNSQETTQPSNVSSKEEDILRATQIFSFAKHYSKLQTQINDVRNRFSQLDSDVATCLSDTDQRLNAMEKKVVTVTNQFDYVKYYVNELARNLEDIQKDVTTLQSEQNRHKEAEKFLKNIATSPRP